MNTNQCTDVFRRFLRDNNASNPGGVREQCAWIDLSAFTPNADGGAVDNEAGGARTEQSTSIINERLVHPNLATNAPIVPRGDEVDDSIRSPDGHVIYPHRMASFSGLLVRTTAIILHLDFTMPDGGVEFNSAQKSNNAMVRFGGGQWSKCI